MLLFTKTHEWVRLKEGDLYYIGITDYAQKKLGDIVFIELPSVEEEVEKEGILATIESVKAVAEVYAPFSGKVVEVNSSLEEEPQKINKSPYEEGWIVLFKKIGDIEGLLTEEEYKKFLEEEEE